MKRSDVKIGGVYVAKVTNRLVEVQIERESRYGGWDARNLITGKNVRIRTASRLRDESGKRTKANSKNTKRDGTVVLTTDAAPADTSQIAASTNEMQAQPVAAPITCPNCGGTETDEDGDCKKRHEPKIAENSVEAGKATKPHPKKIKSAKPKRLSGLDAAAKVLKETGIPMNVKEITEVAFAKGYWKPAGRTPSATLAAALIREITKKGSNSRFRKSERGKFVRA